MRGDALALLMHILPGEAGLVTLDTGQCLDIVDVDGKQVADLVAFSAARPEMEWLSPTHTRSSLGRVRLQRGDMLVTNLRLPILTLVHDDVGVHDMSSAMCDHERYRLDYGLPDHPSCRQAMAAVLSSFGISAHRIPDPVNVFQNTTIRPDGVIETNEPMSRTGDRVSFLALTDSVLVVSACPQDQTPCNAWNPSPIAIRVTTEVNSR